MTANAVELRQVYDEQGYVALPRFYPHEVTRALYRRLVDDLQLTSAAAPYTVTGPLLAKPAIEVYSHGYPFLAAFLWGATPRMTELVGRELLPTYCYFRIYQKGDVCRVHADRHACEHSLSLMLELSDAKAWALAVERRRIDGPTTTVEEDFGEEDFGSVPMLAGDAVMYQGVHHRHGRVEPNPNRWTAHLFMHWVDAAGPYRDHAFDRVMLKAHGMKAPA